MDLLKPFHFFQESKLYIFLAMNIRFEYLIGYPQYFNHHLIDLLNLDIFSLKLMIKQIAGKLNHTHCEQVMAYFYLSRFKNGLAEASFCYTAQLIYSISESLL